jgi:hypothetical protein
MSQAVEGNIDLATSNAQTAAMSNIVGMNIVTRAKSAYAASQAIASQVDPLGQARQSLAQVVNIVDGLVEVSAQVLRLSQRFNFWFRPIQLPKRHWLLCLLFTRSMKLQMFNVDGY